ncbi:unnamed protein product [Caenorhabditis nigoni]
MDTSTEEECMKYTLFFLEAREVNLTKLDFEKGRSWDWRRQGFLCEFSFSRASNHRKDIWSRNGGSFRIRNGEWNQCPGDACRPGNKHLIPRKVKPSYGGTKKKHLFGVVMMDRFEFEMENGGWNQWLGPFGMHAGQETSILFQENHDDGSIRIRNGEWRMESIAGPFGMHADQETNKLTPRKVKPSYWWTFIQLVLSFERKADGSFRIRNGEWKVLGGIFGSFKPNRLQRDWSMNRSASHTAQTNTKMTIWPMDRSAFYMENGEWNILRGIFGSFNRLQRDWPMDRSASHTAQVNTKMTIQKGWTCPITTKMVYRVTTQRKKRVHLQERIGTKGSGDWSTIRCKFSNDSYHNEYLTCFSPRYSIIEKVEEMNSEARDMSLDRSAMQATKVILTELDACLQEKCLESAVESGNLESLRSLAATIVKHNKRLERVVALY